MKKSILFLLSGLLSLSSLTAQKLVRVAKKKGISLRGLSVVDDRHFWASGTKGTVAHSTNGRRVNWLTVTGYEDRDFRDIEAINDSTVVIMAIDNPAVILKTTDAGLHWQKVYEKKLDGIFLDAMSFDGQHGICMGDPIDGRPWILETTDGGTSWNEIPTAQKPEFVKGEAMFAASGSNIQFFHANNTALSWGVATGGTVSRLFMVNNSGKAESIALPLIQGNESSGAFSWATNGQQWVVVGGDYKLPAKDSANNTFTTDGGKTWQSSPALTGFKSSVIWKTDKTLAACGTSGVSVTQNGISDWVNFSKKPFHVLAKAPNGKVVYLAGPNGTIAKLLD